MLLTRYENEGVLHVALVSRGNATLSEELLNKQDDILNVLYNYPLEAENELLESTLNNTTSVDEGIEEAEVSVRE